MYIIDTLYSYSGVYKTQEEAEAAAIKHVGSETTTVIAKIVASYKRDELPINKIDMNELEQLLLTEDK
jgi:hypothetical protein